MTFELLSGMNAIPFHLLKTYHFIIRFSMRNLDEKAHLTVPLKDDTRKYQLQKERFVEELKEASTNCGAAALVSL